MVVRNLLKYLFTWWNGSTVGTNLYTFLKGKKVGEDHFGNSYYESKDKQNRWCIYSNQSEASKISPEWNNWLRYISDTVPKFDKANYKWQKRFSGNVTGLNNAYRPRVVKANKSKEGLDNYQVDYKAWKPE